MSTPIRPKLFQAYLPRPIDLPPALDVGSLDEVFGRVVAPGDLIAAIFGRRGAVLHCGGGDP
jgi:hypothetical protein